MSWKTADKMFTQLCEDVDYWKEEAQNWKEKYEKLNAEYMDLLDGSRRHASAMMANQLKLCMAVDPDKLRKKFGELNDEVESEETKE